MQSSFPVSYHRFSKMNTRFQVPEDNQDNQDNRIETTDFNSFKGTYVGNDLISHLILIDPQQYHFQYVSDYINAFPPSMCFFEHYFPFYMGSHVSQEELVSFYEEHYCSFVEFFQLNHPDWREYTNKECLQHFKNALDSSTDLYDLYSSANFRKNQTTPRTLEKPHFSVYGVNNGAYIGIGYFPNTSGETTAFYRQMGQHGPFGYNRERFNLENYLRERERDDNDNDNNNHNQDVDFYLEKGCIQFDFDKIDNSRHICDYSDDVVEVPENAYFLFEKILQREKREKKQAKEEEMRHASQEDSRQEIRRAREARQRERSLRMRNITTTDDWVRNTSQAFRHDSQSMIEIQAIFASNPMLPFEHRGDLPVPRANPTDYREPLSHYNEEEESE